MATDISSINIENLFSSLSIQDLQKCKAIITKAIEQELVKDKLRVKSVSVNQYVTQCDNYIDVDGELYQGLLEDINSTKLSEKSKFDNKISNVWISTINQPYSWASKSTGKTYSFEAQSFNEYPTIEKLCNQINQENNSNLNSCLVTYYPSGKSSLGIHADNEPNMDSTEPISVLSVGTAREIDFIKKYERSMAQPELTVIAKGGSMYTMLPLCQDMFRHRVNSDNNIKAWRVCLSFRRMLTLEELEKNNACVKIVKPANDIVVGNTMEHLKSTLSSSGSITPNFLSRSEPRKNADKNKFNVSHIEAHRFNLDTTRSVIGEHYGTTVLFGTSISKHIKSNLLEGRYNNFINLSKSGAKISDIENQLDEFTFTHHLAGDVRKIIFNFGTNDVVQCRYNRQGKSKIFKCKEHVFNLISRTRNLFPEANIYIIPVLPMKNLYHYTVPNVLNFNQFLEEAATQFVCVYLDCVRYFLTYDLYDINRYLYSWDGLHLNGKGLKILGNWIYNTVYYSTNSNYISSLSEFY